MLPVLSVLTVLPSIATVNTAINSAQSLLKMMANQQHQTVTKSAIAAPGRFAEVG